MLDLQSVPMPSLPRTKLLALDFVYQRRVVRRICSVRRWLLIAGNKPLDRKLPDGLEHPDSGFTICGPCLQDQTRINERSQILQDVRRMLGTAGADLFRCFERASTGENSKPTKQNL